MTSGLSATVAWAICSALHPGVAGVKKPDLMPMLTHNRSERLDPKGGKAITLIRPSAVPIEPVPWEVTGKSYGLEQKPGRHSSQGLYCRRA